MKRLIATFKEIARYPSAVVGLAIIFGLILIAIYTLFAIPYNEAVRLWRGGEDVWYSTPKNASPSWVNWFRSDKLPNTVVMSTQNGDAEKTYTTKGDSTEIAFSFIFVY